jgi:hypothetical protein
MTDARVCGGRWARGLRVVVCGWVGVGEEIVGRYEGAWDNDKRHGHGTSTWASGNRCARHVEGGPHRPLQAGPGADDSIIYVVYHASQCLPEFIVTYRKT